MPEDPNGTFSEQGTSGSGGGRISKRRYAKFVAVFVTLIVLVWGGFFAYRRYFSPEAKRDAEIRANYEKATQAMQTFEDALRADTYGGTTPEETLALFIDALKKGNTGLASKYFALNTNMNSPDYLTRREWETALDQAKTEGKLERIVGVLEGAVPDLKNRSYVSDYKLETLNADGSLAAYVDMELNKYSNVWKIESM